jgi:hypothetical protein
MVPDYFQTNTITPTASTPLADIYLYKSPV